MSAGAATGPVLRLPSSGPTQPFLAVEGSLVACLTGTCGGFAPGVRLTVGLANRPTPPE